MCGLRLTLLAFCCQFEVSFQQSAQEDISTIVPVEGIFSYYMIRQLLFYKILNCLVGYFLEIRLLWKIYPPKNDAKINRTYIPEGSLNE